LKINGKSSLENSMINKIALVTNVLDYVGPPAVNALLESGYDVVAHDPAFQDTNQREDYKLLGISEGPLDNLYPVGLETRIPDSGLRQILRDRFCPRPQLISQPLISISDAEKSFWPIISMLKG
jgi:hypothetical protein